MTRQLYDYRSIEALRFIDSYIAEFEYSPTYREIMLALGMSSPGTVMPVIARMIDDGLVTIAPSSSARTIRLTDAGREKLLASVG